MSLGLPVGNRIGGVVVGNGFGLADLSLGLPISTWWWVLRNELISAWWWVLRNEEGRNEEEKRNKEREKKKS
jgi:hypothetical protein